MRKIEDFVSRPRQARTGPLPPVVRGRRVHRKRYFLSAFSVLSSAAGERIWIHRFCPGHAAWARFVDSLIDFVMAAHVNEQHFGFAQEGEYDPNVIINAKSP